jgi:glycosyltransferase involved in cell wall biosynthesis
LGFERVKTQTTNSVPVIKLLVVVEPYILTGSARHVLDFCRNARDLQPKFANAPRIETSILTFHREHQSASSTLRGLVRAEKDRSSMWVDESPNQFVATARVEGLEVDVIEENFRFDWRVIESLRRIVSQRAPDIILTHQVKSHFLMRVSGLWRKYPWVAFHHGYTTTSRKMHLYNRLDRWSLPSAKRVVAVCHAFARQLESVGVPRERISVVHNSINPDFDVKARESEAILIRERLKIAPTERVVLAVGRLSREKAHADLVNAFAHLRRTHPGLNTRLVIVGDGPEMQPLKRRIAELGLTEHAHLTGHVTNASPYYSLADVLALPSQSEGSPYVLLEAMAAGLAIVATSVGGIPEAVEHEKSALLVAPGEPQALAEALAQVLSDDALAEQLGRTARATVRERHAPESHLRQLIEIYCGLLPNAATRTEDLRPASEMSNDGLVVSP